MQIYWSDSGELCCIATDESFFILKYSTENVAKAQETPEVMTEDGIEDAFDVRFVMCCIIIHVPGVSIIFEEGRWFEYYRVANFCE